MRYILKLSAAIIFVLCATPSIAQYTVDNWATSDGLPQVSVYSIIQTRDNYLWMATLDGLVRFDGVRFKVFNKSNSQGIVSNRFFSLFEDLKGDIWAGTEQSGLVRLHNGEFVSFGIESGLTSLRIAGLSGDADGNLVVYPANLDKFVRWTGQKFEPFEHTRGPERPGSTRELICIVNANSNECFGGGYRYTSLIDPKVVAGEPKGAFRVVSDSAGSIWITTRDKKLWRMAGSDSVQIDVPGRVLGSVIGPRPGFLWATPDGKIGITRTNTLENQFLVVDAPKTVLEAVGYLSTLEDPEGNIWIGTARTGLSRVKRQFISTLSTEKGLSDNNVYPIFQDHNGVIWVGTNGGLFRYENGIFVRVKEAPATSVNAIGEDSSGHLIFACEGVRTLLGGTAPIILNINSILTKVYVIHLTPDGSLWVGGQGGVMRISDGEIESFTAKKGLAGDDVKSIIDDGDGGVWIGAYGGLSHFNKGELKGWTKNEGLPSETIRSLHRDDDGTLWIGSYDGGLARFRDGRFSAFTMTSGLFNDGVFQILEDDSRNFWISSNHGIYRVRRDDLNRFAEGQISTITSIAYGISDGMKSFECNGGRSPAGMRARDGKLWFPTQDGVSVIDPQNIVVNPKPPPVVIEEVRVDNQSIDPVALYSVIHDPTSGITIAPDRNNFEVEYTALSFINSNNSRFKYKLVGLESDWVDAGTRRTAYYSYVPPGTYTFQVIASNSDGIWNDSGTALTVTVIPPYYKRWWFVFLSLGVLLFFGFMLYRRRIDMLMEAGRRQEEFSRRLLASQEEERQRIAAAMHDTLGQSLLIIKNRVALAQKGIGNIDVIEEQLEELSDSASAAIDECREIAYNLRPYQISRFGLSKTLGAIFSRIGEVTAIGITVDIADIDDKLTDEAEIGIFRIVQECANNIIKHSRASNALISIKWIGHEIIVVISDDGAGYDRASGNGEKSSKGGFGLVGIAERIKMLGGTYLVETSPGNGTRVLIKLNNVRSVA